MREREVERERERGREREREREREIIDGRMRLSEKNNRYLGWNKT